MILHHSDIIRNGFAAVITSLIPLPAQILLIGGGVPASAAAADAGAVAASIQILSLGYMADPVAGVAALQNAFSGTASASVTVTHYRIVGADGITHEVGDTTLVGGGGAMEITGATLALQTGQPLTVTLRTITGANP